MLIQKSIRGSAAAIIMLIGGTALAAVTNGAGKKSYYPREVNYSDNRGIYIEAMGGYAFRDWIDSVSPFNETGTTTNFIESKGNTHSGFTFGFGGGYQFNRNFSVEAGWAYLPTARFDVKNADGSITARNRVTSNLFYGDVKGSIPIFNNTAVFGKLGAAYLRSKADVAIAATGQPVVDAISESNNWSPIFAAGVQHYFTPNVSMSVQYTYVPGDYGVSKDHFETPPVQMITASVGYKFLV